MTMATQRIEEMFLLHLRYKEATHREAGGNRPILLTDPSQTWIVYTGHVDLFLIEIADGQVVGARTHLLRASAGDGLFATPTIEADGRTFGLLAVGTRQASVLQIPTGRLHALSEDREFQPAVTELVDGWIRALSGSVIGTQPPKETVKLLAGEQTALKKQASASAKKGVVWVRHDEGHSHFLGDTSLPSLNGKLYWPLSQQTWIESAESSTIHTKNTQSLLNTAATWPGLDKFHHVVLLQLAHWKAQQATLALARQAETVVAAQQAVATAFGHLTAPLADKETSAYADVSAESPLLAACQLIGTYLGIEMKPPVEAGRSVKKMQPIQEIARASHVNVRQILLRGTWWKADSGPLLASLVDGDLPVALLPAGPSRYVLHNPTTQETNSVTPDIAATLKPTGHVFYRPLPEHSLNSADIARFALRDMVPDLRRLAFAGTVLGLLGLILPAATGLLFSSIIPNAASNQLLQFGLALITVTVVMMLFQVTQNIAVLRLQDKWGATLQAAVWQRLLNLPVSFFRDYTAGDLGVRVMGINAIQQTLSGTLVGSLIAGIVSLFSFLLLFYIDGRLALLATGLVLVAVLVTVGVGYLQLRYSRQLMALQGTLAGQVLQTVTGIAKFRVTGAEHRAFASWAEDFGRTKQINFDARDTSNKLVVFNASYTLLTTTVVFALVAFRGDGALSTPAFLAFNAAFVQLVASLLMLGQAAVAVMNIVPAYERLQPILRTVPELDAMKVHPGELNGEIEISHVTFRYAPDKPPVLRDFSLSIQPGEFVAIVGASGAGKSTLFRLLLGFESAESGAIYFDGHDLDNLDLQAVRQQIGVVLQASQVMPGTIMTNIIGSSLLTMDDAWEAAKLAGMEEDIRQMPMGMHTVVSAGGSTISGGQQQRLLIARAVANRPRIIFFDEATSALDNATQSIVGDSLESLQATRIIIAHRLSTIINADRIIVMDQGQVAEEGTYSELMAQNGIFTALAQRQIA